MKIGLDIDKELLISKIHREYGIEAESFVFLPKGLAGYCYIIECPNDVRYLLKLFGNSRLGQISASRLDFYLPLTWNLYFKGLLRYITYPIKTQDGGFKAEFQGHPLALFNFIEGKALGCESSLSDEVLAKLADLVGILHRITPEIGIESPRVERFDIVFEEDLINGLCALEHITTRDNQGKQELRRLLLPRKQEILGYLERLKVLRNLAQAAGKKMVLCHTDLHGDNLIMNDQGDLYILDWEGAMIAPPEHDLFFCAWEDRFTDIFLANYELEFEPVTLDCNVFGFYYYRRNLEDLTDWIIRILYENTDDKQSKRDIEGIIEDCISGWPYFETTIRKIGAKLK